jgi:uncharacterized protein YjbI with pentapeptide repeats
VWQIVPNWPVGRCKLFRLTPMAELTRKEMILILAAAPDIACQRSEHRVCLAGVDLSGLDLRGLNLAHADLAGADLGGCDLSDARLFEADLSSANLDDALLCGVYADGATFVAARLVRADFRKSRRDLFYGTHLNGADFRGADLTDTRFDGASLSGAQFHESGPAPTVPMHSRDDAEFPAVVARRRRSPLTILSPASAAWCRRIGVATSTEAA